MRRIVFFKIICLAIFAFTFFAKSMCIQTHDRWVEVDINWFHPNEIDRQAEIFIKTYQSLFKGADGDMGVLLCPNWLVDFVTEFNGNLDQKLPFRESIFKHWNNCTYRDFARLISALKNQAEKCGIRNFHIGIFVVGWPDFVVPGIYDMKGEWNIRHPEVSKNNTIIPHAKLKPDKYPYASMPGGITEGVPFARFFGQQWGRFQKQLESM